MKNILFAISLVLALSGYAQQAEHYTQYQFNQFAFNPAVAGTKKCVDIRTGYRFQWVGIEDAPQVGFANVHAPIRFSKRKKSVFGPKHGAGLQIKRDQFGAFSMLQAELVYALHLPVNRTWQLSFGVSFGMKQTTFDYNKITTELGDPLLPGGKQSFVMFPDGKLGIWLNNDKTYMGLSVHHLFGNRFKNPGGGANLIGTSDSKLQRHFYLTGGHRFALEKNWSFIPSIFVLYTAKTPIDFHLSALFDLNNKFSMGVGLRRTDAVTAQVRIKLFNLISLGYSFDYVISKLGSNIFHTHEITAGFNSCSNYGEASTVSCPAFE